MRISKQEPNCFQAEKLEGKTGGQQEEWALGRASLCILFCTKKNLLARPLITAL